MSIIMPTYVDDMRALGKALASQGYHTGDDCFRSDDGGLTGHYFYPSRHKETSITIHMDYDEGMKFHTISQMTIHTPGKLKVLTTDHFDPRKFNDVLETIVEEANARLHKNIEYDGFVRPDYMAALVAEIIEDAYELYHSE